MVCWAAGFCALELNDGMGFVSTFPSMVLLVHEFVVDHPPVEPQSVVSFCRRYLAVDPYR